MSANGMIAQTQGQSSLDWTSKEDLRFFVEKTKEAGVLVMGRKTFETIGKALPGRTTVVMTRRAEEHPSIEGVVFTTKTPREIIDEYASRGQASIVIAGGAEIYSAFLQEQLVTDLFLTVEPVLFGQGTPIAKGFDRINMRFIRATPLGEQAILLHYQPTYEDRDTT